MGTIFLVLFFAHCGKTESGDPDDPDPGDGITPVDFHFGADLSYINQIMDHGGKFFDGGTESNPYRIMKDHGTGMARFRIWHNPVWTKDIYGASGTQLYNDLLDVEKAISESKTQGMKVLLDFHYSDTWADPGKQVIPRAWMDITSIEVLEDSVYNYTFNTLKYLDSKGLMPEFVQIGNEINCGMMYSEAPKNFPKLNICDGNWSNLGQVINGGIKAVREVSAESEVDTEVILHVADPKNVQWWFDNMMDKGNVTDFEVVGFSYYPIWHTTIGITELGKVVAAFKSRFSKEIMILETAYPWTSDGNDNYNNIFGAGQAISGYPFTQQGQLAMMRTLTKQMISGGGYGIIYWEPGWITSQMKDLWGTGSSWENCALFDFNGNLHQGIQYMTDNYESE